MTKPWPQILGVAIGFVSAMALYQLSRRVDSISTGPRRDLIEIGRIEAIDGQVERRPPGAVSTETVPAPGPLHHQELLITQRGSSATLHFTESGTTIKMKEATRLIAERDPVRKDGVIATLLDGDAQLVKAGKRELFKFYRNGREVALEDLGKTQIPSIQATPAELTGPPLPPPTPPTLVITATKPAETPVPAQAATSADEFNSEILTNDDILRQMRRQSGLFQRCYLSHIHRAQAKPGETPMTGTIMVTFTIESNGKVSEARQLKSDFKDKTLNSCVLEVVQRTTFKGFNGKPVPVLEFPISLQ